MAIRPLSYHAHTHTHRERHIHTHISNLTLSLQGKPVYMAPEQLKDDRHGLASDVWALVRA